MAKDNAIYAYLGYIICFKLFPVKVFIYSKFLFIQRMSLSETLGSNDITKLASNGRNRNLGCKYLA